MKRKWNEENTKRLSKIGSTASRKNRQRRSFPIHSPTEGYFAARMFSGSYFLKFNAYAQLFAKVARETRWLEYSFGDIHFSINFSLVA
mmetsp:Transcript_69199/g.184425  ORF Transcript_69199/g.184425 Transcript_69199/m.184425 type:complete len:88 (+) Transcript_69199:424-687(+)